MTGLTKKAKSLGSSGNLTRPRSLKRHGYEAVNKEALKGIISYLSYLYTEGEISDRAYKALVSQVLSTYVNNSVSFEVEKVFE